MNISPNLPLIFIPGLLCDSELFLDQINVLKTKRDCRVLDTTSRDRIEDLVSELLPYLPDRFALAGLSMGGYVAFEIVRRIPKRVERLCLMNTSARPDTEEQKLRRKMLIAMSKRGQFKGVTPKLLPLLIHPDRLSDEELTTRIRVMAERVGRDAFYNQQNAILNRTDNRSLLETIRCPTLVIGGNEDLITPPLLLEEIANGITGAQLRLLEKCGHLSVLERPSRVTELMLSWLDVSE